MLGLCGVGCRVGHRRVWRDDYDGAYKCRNSKRYLAPIGQGRAGQGRAGQSRAG